MTANWKKEVVVHPAAECFPNGDPAPECVAEYRVYFPGGYKGEKYDPYQDGLVIERFKDGRYYLILGNQEFANADLGVIEAQLEDYARGEDYIDADGNLTMSARPTARLADEAVKLEWGSEEQVAAENEFGERVRRLVSAEAWARYESYALKATTEEIIDFGKELLAEAQAASAARVQERTAEKNPHQFVIDGLELLLDDNSDANLSTFDRRRITEAILLIKNYGKNLARAGSGTVPADSVQALFGSLFPKLLYPITINGGAETPVDSVCGSDCAHVIRAAYVLANLAEVDQQAVARIAADACEVYING